MSPATAAPPRTRLQVDQRRQQLIELGLELFGHQTYDDLSIDEIAKKAGISKGLLYHYFPSKRAFYVAAVQEAARQLLDETNVDQSTAGPPPDMALARTALRGFLQWAHRRHATFTFLLRGGVGTDPEVGAIVESTRQALLDRLLRRFGVTKEDPGTRLRLRGWLGFIEGATLDWVETQDLDLDSFCDLLVQMAGVILPNVLNPQAG